jgi:hypothetical protein
MNKPTIDTKATDIVKPSLVKSTPPDEWKAPANGDQEPLYSPDPKIAQAVAIVTNQQTVNEQAGGKDWLAKSRSGEYDQAMAVFDEMVEFRNSWVRFRWWGGSESPLDKSNAKMELVDALHFSISQLLAKPDATVESVANTLVDSYYKGDSTSSDSRLAFKKYVASTLLGEPDMSTFFELCADLDMTWDHLATYYLGKATLNKFRAANGYSAKPRTYIKNWRDGKEDNFYLMAYIDSGLTYNDNISQQAIQEWLEEEYRAVVQSNRHLKV